MAHSAPKRRKIDVEEEAKDAVESEDESESEDEMSIVVASGSKHREKKARHDESRSKVYDTYEHIRASLQQCKK